MASKKNELDQIFVRFGIKRGNRRTKLNTFTEADVSSLTKDNSDNRDNTGWPSGQHIVLTAACSEANLATVLKNWKALTDKDPDQPSTQRLYIPDGEQGYQCYDAVGTPVGGIDTLENILKANEIPLPENLHHDQYLAAIRTKPFLLLAGISGTGKSRLVRQLARGCCPAESELAEGNPKKPGNFEMIQVRPNWHDSSELMGYVSRINGKPEYVVTPFLKFLAKAWMFEADGIPFFLCLDEMNLAPVEQYFAEYLSIIETREIRDGNIVTDPLFRLPDDEVAVKSAFCRIFAGVDHEKAQPWIDKFMAWGGIPIPSNLVVMGTVNMDETTFSFSRKVLDRAMSFELNEVHMDEGLEVSNDIPYGALDKACAKCSYVQGSEVYKSDSATCESVKNYLISVNEKLEETPFKIAYRTRNEIMIYCVERTKNGTPLAQALDEATSMKILSRVEGDRKRLGTLLDMLKDTIKEQLKIVRGGEGEYTESAICKDKIESMKRQLASGYTSFWTR